MICRSCGAKNPEEARFCLRCGANLRGSGDGVPKKRKSVWPLLLILLVLLTFLLTGLAFAGLAMLGPHHSGSSVAAFSTTPTVAPTPAPTSPTAFSFTDPNTGVRTTVESPRIDRSGDAGKKPSAGKEFVILPATVHNGGSGEAVYFGLDFSAYDQNDRQYNRVQQGMYPTKDGTYIGFGALGKGQTHSGVVVFELPVNTAVVTIKWDDNKKINPPKRLGTFQLG